MKYPTGTVRRIQLENPALAISVRDKAVAYMQHKGYWDGRHAGNLGLEHGTIVAGNRWTEELIRLIARKAYGIEIEPDRLAAAA